MDKPDQSQFRLLTERRFLPLFCTQFLGALNDNIYKNALMILIAFYSTQGLSMDPSVLINIAAGLFILPFFLFSATAGQIADKYEKAGIIRNIKIVEIFIMLAAALALWSQSLTLMMLVLFALGTQSVFFGPVKYAILPQHLQESELVGGNAQIEMGTFVAILIGTIGGGLAASSEQGVVYISIAILGFALLGYLSSRSIPSAPPSNSAINVNWNPITETWRTLKMAGENQTLFLSIMGISWFWLLGAAYLSQIPVFSKIILGGDSSVVTVLLCFFTVGIAAGSLLCERLSGHKIEIGLVPFGAIGLSVFGIDLYFACQSIAPDIARTYSLLFNDAAVWRVLMDFSLLGLCGGFYIVPLYALIQQRSKPEQRAQMIAANNILNALFMVISALMAILLLGLAGLSIPEFFLIIALMNIAVSLFIFAKVPEFTMRFAIWLLSHTLYRVKHSGLDNVPDQGGAIIVCNHVSFVDALLLAGAVRRPIRFIMFKPIFDIPVLNFIFRTGRAIPIESQHTNKAAYDKAFDEIEEGLKAGDLLCIFPEGKLTVDGEMNEFKTGIEKILEKTPVPVIPMALRGLWGSFFSHKDGAALATRPKRFWSRVEIAATTAVAPELATAQGLQDTVFTLRGANGH